MTKLGEAFGLQLLLIISYVYIKCITSPFKFLVSIFFPQTDAQTFFLVYFWWLFLYFSIAVVVFKVCTDTTIEARKTNVIVWDNVHEHHNLSIAEKLKTFSAKMNHNNYKFTACGFFVLELSTLSSMLLSVTTQLFILFSIIRQG
ncbi:uncharacterized protein LOC106667026 [Cimex lectularius]|uniref:Gustatory receptor n=1 Tax=Cimex lectularius TaxID=79782 RepID=A0A8I6SFJ9_CIMLE|nr:uncharacterized protein LOC106667026 [Cimex lectularius]